MTAEQLRGNVKEEVAAGEAALAAAEKLLEVGLSRDAASRAYYAAFHLARALCWAADADPKTHRGVAHLLHEHYIRTQRLDASTDRLFHALQDLRDHSDYGAGFTLDDEGARQAVAMAKTLVGAMRRLLSEQGHLS